MKQPDVRYAMISREWGLRRVRRLTWGIAGAGAVGAMVLVAGFGGHVHLPKINQPARGSQVPAGNQGTGQSNQGTGQSNQGTGQSNQGTGQSNQGTGQSNQGTGQSNQGTGQSNQGTGGQQAGSQAGGGQLQAPAANPAPAQGPGQVVSGGS